MRIVLLTVFLLCLNALSAQDSADSLVQNINEKPPRVVVQIPSSTIKLDLIDGLLSSENTATFKSDLPIRVFGPRHMIEAEFGIILNSIYAEYKEESHTGFKTGLSYKFIRKARKQRVKYIGLELGQSYALRTEFKEVLMQANYIEERLISRNINGLNWGVKMGRYFFIGATKRVFIEPSMTLGGCYFNSNLSRAYQDLEFFDFRDGGFFFGDLDVPLSRSQRPYLKLDLNVGLAYL